MSMLLKSAELTLNYFFFFFYTHYPHLSVLNMNLSSKAMCFDKSSYKHMLKYLHFFANHFFSNTTQI